VSGKGPNAGSAQYVDRSIEKSGNRTTIVLTLVATLAGVVVGALVVRLRAGLIGAAPREPAVAASNARGSHASTSTGAAPPKLVGGAGLVADPTAPGYDPVALLGLVKLHELFSQEPRVEPWATEVESWVTSRLRADLDSMMPDVTELKVECKASTCRFTWRSEDSQARVKIRRVLQALYPPSRIDSQGGTIFASYLGGIIKSAPQDSGGLFRELERRRRANLAGIHAGQHARMLYDAFPREAWPRQ
jgi:hypothetical protein